jgi:hypothetical protein
VLALLLGAVLVVLGIRIAADQARQDRLERAADRVDVQVSIGELGVGVDESVVLGITVLGTGAPVQVDRPGVRPAELATVMAIGAPRRVARDVGGQLRLRLHPDCTRVSAARRLDVEVPLTPASGRRHVLRVPVPDGPDMLRRACGYLSIDEALTNLTYAPVLHGAELQLRAGLRNDGRTPLSVTAVRAAGLSVAVAPPLPVALPPRGATVELLLELRVTDCAAVRTEVPGGPLRVLVADAAGHEHEAGLPMPEQGSTYDGFVRAHCP